MSYCHRTIAVVSVFSSCLLACTGSAQILAYHPTSRPSDTSSCVHDRRTVLQTTRATAAAAAALASPLVLYPTSASAAGASSSSQAGGPRVPIDGAKNGFPLASFGLQVYDDNTAYRLTLLALEVGYRSFFASVLAGNQKGFARAIKESGISRDDIYICGSVLSNRAKGESSAYFKTREGYQENMNAMAYGGIGKLDQVSLTVLGLYYSLCTFVCIPMSIALRRYLLYYCG